MPVYTSSSTLENMLGCFEIAANCSGNMIVKILDVQGRIAKTVKQTLEEGIYKLQLNVEDLKQGMYIMNIFHDGDFIKAVRYTKS